MRWSATLAVFALMSPTVALGYTFLDWAEDHGYDPDDPVLRIMPVKVEATGNPALPDKQIDDLYGIRMFDWTQTEYLSLWNNQLSTIGWNLFEDMPASDRPNLLFLYLNDNKISSVEPSDDFSGLQNLWHLELDNNQLSNLESGAFGGLVDLRNLYLSNNLISNIESGAFRGLMSLKELRLANNAERLEDLNLAGANFMNLTEFDVTNNANATSVSLRDTLLDQHALEVLMDGGDDDEYVGIGELDGITELDLNGVDFGSITELSRLNVMDDLTDLWLVDTLNLDAIELDVLLNNLATIEGIDSEGILHMTQANYRAFNDDGDGLLAVWHAEPGHHVELLGDVNEDFAVNGLDVDSFVAAVLSNGFQTEADCNLDDRVNGLDVAPFVVAVLSGAGAEVVPEPSTVTLAILALSLFCWRRNAR